MTKNQINHFQKWIGARTFSWKQEDYLILHSAFCSDVVRALLEHDFLQPMGKLFEIVAQMGLTEKDRKEHPVIGVFNGQIKVFKVIKPLPEFFEKR